MIKKLLLVALCVVAVSANKKAALVSVEKLEKKEVASVENFTGSVAFAKKSKLSIEGNGKIKKLYFQEGDSVRKGDLLLELDTQTLESKIASAKAALNAVEIEYSQANADYQRYKKLLKEESIAQKTFEDSKYKVQGAKAQVEQAKASLYQLELLKEKSSLKAPFSGVVVAKSSEVGEWVSSGSVVAQLVDTSSVELVYNLPTKYASVLQESSQYEVTLGAKSHMATLEAILPSGDSITRTFKVKLSLHTKDFLYEGMEAMAKFPSQKKMQSFVVSRDSVINRFGGNVVIAVVEGKAQIIHVSIKGYGSDYLAIDAKQLRTGMQIVTKGNERVFPNQRVKIVNR